MEGTGQIIKKFREQHQVSQSKICNGICSVSTLSRLEAEQREVDLFLQEALLSRVGMDLRRLEVVVQEKDFQLYQQRYQIRQLVRLEQWSALEEEMTKYEKEMPRQTIHQQFILAVKAYYRKKQKAYTASRALFLEALQLTAERERVLREEQYVNVQEMSILVEVAESFLQEEEENGKKICLWIQDYHQKHRLWEPLTLAQSNYVLGCYYEKQGKYPLAEQCFAKGMAGLADSRYLFLKGDLYLKHAQTMEKMGRTYPREIRLREYLVAYHLLAEQGMKQKCEKIKTHLKEEYQWAFI